MRKAPSNCREARHEMMEALLASPSRHELPRPVARHVTSCRECAGHWRRLLAATHLFVAEPAYAPWLRDRTLARLAGRAERAPLGAWAWLALITTASLVAAYIVPTLLLSRAFESLLGSPDAGLIAALLLTGSLSLLLPASIAAPLLRLRPNGGFLPDIYKEVFHD